MIPQHRRRPRGRVIQRPEQGLQIGCADLLRTAVPKPPDGPFWTAINPIPAKSKAVAGLSKAMGLRAGVTDFLLIFRGLPILIELKGTGYPSKAQRELHEEIRAAGGVVYPACRSILEFKQILTAQGIPCRAEVRGEYMARGVR